MSSGLNVRLNSGRRSSVKTDYHGSFILEDDNLAAILQEEWKKGLRIAGIACSIKVGF